MTLLDAAVMPGQQTFKLVPTTLVNPVGVRPPMTSKAAKEAYRKATKGPKISRAEQRRIDAAEIERQKKEYEKERNAAKAKAARDKKLKKEAEEKEERRKKGLPEPNRFVRASQPTIKGFVRIGAGEKRSWEVMDREQSSGRVEGPPAKIRTLGALDEGEEDEFEDSAVLLQHRAGQLQGGEECVKMIEQPAKAGAVEQQDDEDGFGSFPSLPQELGDTLLEEVTVRKAYEPLVKATVLETSDTYDQLGDFLSLSQVSRLMDDTIRFHPAPLKVNESPRKPVALLQLDEEDEFGDFPSLSQLADGGSEGVRAGLNLDKLPTKTGALECSDEDDEFGEFPALSQMSLGLFDTPILDARRGKDGLPRQSTVNKLILSPTKSHLNSPHLQPWTDNSQSARSVHGEELDALVESQLLSEAFGTKIIQNIKPAQKVPSTEGTERVAKPAQPHTNFKPLQQNHLSNRIPLSTTKPVLSLPVAKQPRNPSTPCAITTVNRSARRPLADIPKNMAPPPRPRHLKSVAYQQKQPTKGAEKPYSAPPPSTLAFLEANFDDFFPSPSQQARELIEDINDLPSNTQIAREIETESKPPAAAVTAAFQRRLSIPIFEKEVNPECQLEHRMQIERSEQHEAKQDPQPEPQAKAADEDLDLHLLSSQDFEISSQDLREIETPSRVNVKINKRPTSSHEDLGLVYSSSPKVVSPKPKRRFFEEKEDDLLHAALHESLAMSRKEEMRTAGKEMIEVLKENRLLKRTDSTQTDYGEFDFRDMEYDDDNDDDDNAFGYKTDIGNGRIPCVNKY